MSDRRLTPEQMHNIILQLAAGDAVPRATRLARPVTALFILLRLSIF